MKTENKKVEEHQCDALKKWSQAVEEMLDHRCGIVPGYIFSNDEYYLGNSIPFEFCPCCGAKIYKVSNE